MGWLLWLYGAAAVGVAGYMVTALLRPDKF